MKLISFLKKIFFGTALDNDRPTPPDYRLTNHLPNGLILLQETPNCAVDLSGDENHGWLYYQAPGAEWVKYRKLLDWEIMQAEDQRDECIVLQGPLGQNRRYAYK
jgi:hypothetical protein